MGKIKRGEMWLTNNEELVRVVQNNVGNKHSSTTIIEKEGGIYTVSQNTLISKTEDVNNSIDTFEKKIVHNLKHIKRCKIVYVDFGKNKESSVQSGMRPAVIIKNGKNYLAIPLTSKNKNYLPTHVFLSKKCGLKQNSLVLCEQIFTLKPNEICFNKTVTKINKYKTQRIKEALACSLGIKRGLV